MDKVKRVMNAEIPRNKTQVRSLLGLVGYYCNMAFVHRQSCEGVKSELDIFAVPPKQTSIEDGRWVEHQRLASLDSGEGSNRIRDTWNRRCLPRSCQHIPAHSS